MAENKKSVGFVPFEVYEGRKNIGSSRIRAQWLVNHWPEAEIFKQGKRYDTIIFQKAYWVKMAQLFNGVKIFDICDADFLHWAYHTAEMVEYCDAVVASTEALAVQFRQFTDKPVVCIPDRVDLDKFTKKKNHKGQGRARAAVWFGYSDNFQMLNTAIAALEKLKLNLIVISDKSYYLQSNYVKPEKSANMGENEIKKIDETIRKKPFWIEVTNIKWDPETVNDSIITGDIIINPKSDKGKWKYKSENKTLTGWALGMPVARDMEELERFLDEGERIKEAEVRGREVIEKWDVRISVQQYKDLISSIKK